MKRKQNLLTIFMVVFAFNCYVVFGKPDKTVMKEVSIGFGKSLEDCREESGLTEELMKEFVDFWRDDVQHIEFGCAVFCMARTLGLLNENHRIHHDNTETFIKSFSQGELIAKKMVELIHSCELKNDHIEENCLRVFENIKCFKTDAILTGLAPTEEMLTEIIL